MKSRRPTVQWQDLGRVGYRDAWALQDELRARRAAGEVPDRVLLLEHDPVITLGRRDCSQDVVSSAGALAADGIELIQTNRGGRATYHGPGQLVGYLICELAGMGVGVKDFVHRVEEILMRALGRFGIEACRDERHPGLWVGRDKIAAIGLNVQRGITQHGFALNVGCDLGAYRHIVACGISDRGVTTMDLVAGRAHPMDEVKRRVVECAGDVLDSDMVELIRSD